MNIALVLPYEYVKKYNKFRIDNVKTDVTKFIDDNFHKSCTIAEYPFSLCYIIQADLDNDEIDKLKHFGIIELLLSPYKDISNVDYTMLKFDNIEITEEILNNYREKL